MSKAIEKRQGKEKGMVLEQLKKIPIIQLACEKSGVGRATYYRWRKDDPEFAKLADEALAQGTLLINDLAESKLIASVQNQNMTAIIFWLKNHHPAYTTKIELTTQQLKAELSEEEKIAIEKVLGLTGVTKEINKDGNSK